MHKGTWLCQHMDDYCMFVKFPFCGAPMLPLSYSPGVQIDATAISESRCAGLQPSLRGLI